MELAVRTGHASGKGDSMQGQNDKHTDSSSEPTVGVESLGLRTEIRTALSLESFKQFTHIQGAVIRHMTQNPSTDLVSISQPGSGKTTSFCIGLLQRLDLSSIQAQRTPQAMVLVPCLALVEHTVRMLREFGRWMDGLRVHAALGRAGESEANDQSFVSSAIIVGVPLMILDWMTIHYLHLEKLSDIKILIIDEVDLMNLSHHDQNACLQIRRCLITNMQCNMFSAVHNDLGSWGSAFFMKGPPVEIHSGVSSKYTKHFCIEVSDVDSKLEKLFQFFSITTLGSTIVFVKSRKDMLKIFNRLTDDGWPVSIWWGSFPYSSSNDTTWFDKLCFDSRDFLFGSVKVMLASLDLQPKLNIWCRSVFLYDTPDTFGTYVHCVGRASYYRTSYVFTFIIQESEWDLSKLRAIETYFSTCSVHLKWTDMDGLEDLEWMMGDIKRQSLAIQIDKPGVQDGNGAVNQRSSLMDSIYANGVTAQNIKDALSPETSNSGPSNANPLSGKARDDSKKNADIHEGIHEVPKVPKAKSISAQRRHNKKDTSLTVASKASMKGKKKISGQKSPNVNPIDEDQLRVIPQGFFNELNDTIDGRLQFIEGEVPVRIAILDTGIDSNHEDFHKARPRRFTNDLQSEAADEEVPQKFRIKGRRNFCFDGAIDVKEKMIQEQDTNDCDGHGTQVAGIILRVAPNAELYIARICVGHDNTGSSISKDHPFRDPTPDVVAEALEWAIRQKVDIINMSLGFETSSKNVIQALKKAKNHNVLVLAAASNDGPIKDELAWPAKDPFLAIAIHSSKHGGRPSDTAADPQKGRYNFMVVGEDIISQRLSRKSGGFCLCTGSSFATPVATAMCALIIAFMRQELCEDEREATDAEIGAKCLWRVRNIDWMSRLLAEISKEREGFHLLHPKLFWRDYTDDRKRRPAAESRAQAWKMIEKALKHG